MRFMRVRAFIFRHLVDPIPCPKLKAWYLRAFYKWRIGQGNRFWSGMRLDGDTYGRVTIGSNGEFPRGSYFNTNGTAAIVIGDNVIFGHDVCLYGADHDPHDRAFPMRVGDIVIEDGVWLASKVCVLKDVTIGQDTAVGFGSLVTKSLPPNVIAVGMPARPLKKRFEDDK